MIEYAALFQRERHCLRKPVKQACKTLLTYLDLKRNWEHLSKEYFYLRILGDPDAPF
jgi:hypothetical protein